MLNLYQLWLDDLYPRAKFADGLAIVEKLGHTKRMQVMRKAWIDESKPHEPVNDVVLDDAPVDISTHTLSRIQPPHAEDSVCSIGDDGQRQHVSDGEELFVTPHEDEPVDDEDDELSKLLAEDPAAGYGSVESTFSEPRPADDCEQEPANRSWETDMAAERELMGEF